MTEPAQSSGEGFRLSPQQRNLWSLQQTAAGQPFRSLGEILIEGEVDEAQLQQSLKKIVERHEILRTTFRRPPGIKTPFQVVAQESRFSWTALDLSNLNDAAQDEKIAASVSGDRELPFDLEHGPALRVTLITQSADRHRLIVSLPALISDAATLLNFTGELCNAYAGNLGSGDSDAVPMQYADFAEWANKLLEASDESATDGKTHWQNVMATEAIALPFVGRSVGAETFKSEFLSIEVEAPLAKIESLARRAATSVDAVLFACWQALIWRLAGQTESAFRLYNLSAGRKFADLQSALGPFAKFLPIGCRCEDEPFVAHLRRASEAINIAEEWQEYLDPAAFATSEAIAFEFAKRPQEFRNGKLSFSLISQQICLSPFKLKLLCTGAGETLSAALHYNSESFDHNAARQVADYFQCFLSFVVEQPDADLRAVEILSTEERQRLLVEFNQTNVTAADERCVHALFESQAASTPTAVAVVAGDQEITYANLNQRANQLAHFLRHCGVGPDICVGLCVERSVEMIVALLGILKAGGAYVPLNPDQPVERLSRQLKESKAALLVTDNDVFSQSHLRTAGDPPAKGVPVSFVGQTIDLTRDWALLDAQVKENPASIASAEDLVYVIYTSGSTGTPKGVAVRHRNLTNYTQFILRRLKIDGPLNFATVSTISADLGNTCIFPALVSGGCLHILDYDTGLAGDLLRDYIARRPIDVLKIVPSHFRALLATQPDGKILPARYLILGGEALSWDLVRRVSQVEHTCEIINHYGPTETTVGSLTFSVDENGGSRASATVPIGQPIDNTRVYILDARLRPVPIGVPGELYIGGAGVTAGYLNQPEETAARFVVDPFAADLDSRLYRTGDRARYLADGNVEFLGRVDTQVKVRGHRVELGEIEAVLSSCNGVRQAVVTAQLFPGSAGILPAEGSNQTSAADRRLVAYLVSSGAQPLNLDVLRTALKQRLPDYMVPAAFVFLQTLPLTGNGKIDRAALPAPDETRAGLRSNFVAPRTPIEERLAAIWQSLLKVSAVGVHDNFFDLGGHSLLGTQVMSRMRKEFQLEIPLRSLFESPTVAELAVQIETGTNSSDAERLLAELESLSDEEAEELLAREQGVKLAQEKSVK